MPCAPVNPNLPNIPNTQSGINACSYILPIGHMVQGPFIATNGGSGDSYTDPNTGYLISTYPTLGYTGAGILGASYTAAAGIYKNLGYLPQGWDGIDNGGIPGLIDDWLEGVDGSNIALVTARLQNHTHVTARSEMLYALLVEGGGPWGAAFSRDDFSDKEVQDTDNDGLPEFVDGWGHPLQFFRWPILYHSDYQRGQTIGAATAQSWTFGYPYMRALDTREQDPLDLNQQLTAPGWWSINGVGNLAANDSYPQFTVLNGPPVPQISGLNPSGGVYTFGAFFHRLTEPMQAGQPSGFLWDRGGSYRRAFYTKFLILSAGPDGLPGVFLYSDANMEPPSPSNPAGLPNPNFALIANENCAMQFGLDIADFTSTGVIPPNSQGVTVIVPPSTYDPANPNSFDIQNNGQDDITNHAIASAGGLGGSGS